VILIDTGPFVALFDPRDNLHLRCRTTLRSIRTPLVTTIPVLTEAFHILDPTSIGAQQLREFILTGGVGVWFIDQLALKRALELMARYADHPMDLADASLVVAAEALETRKIFTVDRGDFSTYRIQRGHTHEPFEIID
jgi:predicted nucleic acid-binding protein